MDQDAAQHVRARYLDLLELSILNSIYGESRLEMALQGIAQRLRHPYLTRRGTFPWPSRAHSMIGPRRLRNLRELVERTINENVPGDYIETGVWRGGASILMRGVLEAYGIADRRVFCADTFAGLPRPDAEKFAADRRDRLHAFTELAVSEQAVRANFSAYDLLDDRVVFVKGLFKDTLPAIGSDRFALIRLDGDMYESTMDALVNLYDKVPRSGFVIVDDYGGLKNCRRAVHDFLDRRGLRVDIVPIDETGVWWQKD
jgi:O-methyltransferase